MGFSDLISVTEGLGSIGEIKGKRCYQKGAECFECLKEIQRSIRREQNAENKEVLVQLGNWNIVNKHLLPLLCTYREDEKLTFEVCKLLGLMTLPPNNQTSNINEVIDRLQSFKEAFIRNESDPLASFMVVLGGPLSRSNEQSEEDATFIELVLSLFKNILTIPDPLPGNNATNFPRSHMQDDLLIRFSEDNIFELLITLCQLLDSGDHPQSWAFILLEVLSIILQRETPQKLIEVYNSEKKKRVATTQSNLNSTQETSNSETKVKIKQQSSQSQSRPRGSLGSLLDAEKKKRAELQNRDVSTTKFRMKGTFALVDKDGSQKISRAPIEDTKYTKVKVVNRGKGAKKSTNKTDGFSESSLEAKLVIKEFVDQFLEDGCYAKLITTLNEGFENYTESHLFDDQANYLRLIAFMTGFVESEYQMRPNYKLNEDIDISLISATLHPSDFEKLSAFCSMYMDEKNWKTLPFAVKALKEMLKTLRHLLKATDDEKKSIGTRLVGHLFYHNIYTETLINIIKTFTENRASKHYLADAVETADVLIDMMNQYTMLRPLLQQKKKRTSTKKSSKKSKKSKQQENNNSIEGENNHLIEGENNNLIEEANNHLIEGEKNHLIEGENNHLIEEENNNLIEEARAQEEEDEDDEENEGPRAEKIVSTVDYIIKFCSPLIIHNYYILLCDYNTNSQTLNQCLCRMFSRISETDYEALLFQMELLRLFDKIMREKVNYSRIDLRELITCIQKVVKDFIFVLGKNPNLSFFAFVWKKKFECFQLHPNEVARETNYEELSTQVTKINKPKQVVIWTPEEDNILKQVFADNKDEIIGFDLMITHFEDKNKQNINCLYDRLIQIKVIDSTYPLPQGYEELNNPKIQINKEMSSDDEENDNSIQQNTQIEVKESNHSEISIKKRTFYEMSQRIKEAKMKKAPKSSTRGNNQQQKEEQIQSQTSPIKEQSQQIDNRKRQRSTKTDTEEEEQEDNLEELLNDESNSPSPTSKKVKGNDDDEDNNQEMQDFVDIEDEQQQQESIGVRKRLKKAVKEQIEDRTMDEDLDGLIDDDDINTDVIIQQEVLEQNEAVDKQQNQSVNSEEEEQKAEKKKNKRKKKKKSKNKSKN